MNHMSVDQQARAIDYLAERGWAFDIDRFDPRPGYRGWWLHPELRPRRTGDSQTMFYAAEVAFTLAGYGINELAPQYEYTYSYA